MLLWHLLSVGPLFPLGVPSDAVGGQPRSHRSPGFRGSFRCARGAGWRAALVLAVIWLGPVCNSSRAQFPAEAFDTIPAERVSHLGDTQPLRLTGDIASELVDGVDRFLLKQLNASVVERQDRWSRMHRDNRDPAHSRPAHEDYAKAIETPRAAYRRMIGAIDARTKATDWIIESTLDGNSGQTFAAELASEPGLKILRVRWPVFEGLDGVGLILVPEAIQFGAILIPDADQMPETLCGVGAHANTMALELARAGGVVVLPQVISRHREARLGRAIMTDQEYLYRSAFVLGRHLLGTHVQQCLAAIDILASDGDDRPILVGGWGEGGWIAMAVGACDTRVDATIVSGHFGPRESTWKEPIHRNVHGLLTQFGDAELAALVAPRALMVEAIPGPQVAIAGEGGAPGVLAGPDPGETRREFERLLAILKPWGLGSSSQLLEPSSHSPDAFTPSHPNLVLPGRIQPSTLIAGLRAMNVSAQSADPVRPLASQHWERLPSSESRRVASLGQIDRFQQRLLDHVHLERERHWKDLDTSSLERFRATIEPYRNEFRDDIIGRWEIPKDAPSPRTRLVYDREKWRGYEVVLDVFDGVIAYGVLLVPKSDQPIVNRPCVVFQHGLEGRPTDTIVGDHPAYHDVAARLAEDGYVVFAPQNLYLFQDRFRTLQRKSNLLGKTLFSTIVSQHEQLVHWLGKRPEIDPDRIAFYGLSYGGKSAMRIPALIPEYCLSICSADFNDWVWKNASTSSPFSYVWTMEYEIFEFDLGPKFNYAEMAALIAPRPFMVERGHFDGVAPDERVGLEYAKVQRLYAAKLGIPERTAIEWFPGPHTIHGVGTFEFLRRHLKPERTQEK
jgi:dienelactone hydrolase